MTSQSYTFINMLNTCAVCNRSDCHYTLTAQFTFAKSLYALQSPVCGDDQCIQSLRSIKADRITSMYGDDVMIEFYVDNNNDDPFQ